MAHRWTYTDLDKSAERLNPKSRGNKYPYTPKFEINNYTSGPNASKHVLVPYVGTRSLLISLRAWGVTQSNLHAVTMLFGDVDIVLSDPQDRRYFPLHWDGNDYWVRKLNKDRNPLTARCSCADFFFTFAWYNYHNAHCLYGPAPRPYQKKTNRPPRNPQGLPGICKHIHNAWELLRNSGFTEN